MNQMQLSPRLSLIFHLRMNAHVTFTRRAFAPIIEMWAAFLEEEAVLEESGFEPGNLGEVMDFNPPVPIPVRAAAIHGEHSA